MKTIAIYKLPNGKKWKIEDTEKPADWSYLKDGDDKKDPITQNASVKVLTENNNEWVHLCTCDSIKAAKNIIKHHVKHLYDFE